MSRFTLAAAALTIFLLVPDHVAAVRTTVIIDAADENWVCSKGTLWHCKEYMMEEAVRSVGGGVVNGAITGLSRREIDLGMCCCKLKLMAEAAEGISSAVCSGVEEAMRMVVAEQKQRGEVIMGNEELKNAWNVAAELPSKCGVVTSPPKCRFNTRLITWM